MNEFMERALEIAAKNGREGGQPFGAVLEKDGKIIAEGINELHKKYDLTLHAEMVAIRNAQEKLQTNNLSGLVMYASGEPCPLCWTTMYIGGITKAYYCATNEDSVNAGLPDSEKIYTELTKSKEKRSIKMTPFF